MTTIDEELNFHLFHISDLENSNERKDLATCIDHCKAIFDLTQGGCHHRAMKALKIAHAASLELPSWATDFFSFQINKHIVFPKFVSQDGTGIEEVKTLRRLRDICSCAVWLLDSGILSRDDIDKAKPLLKTLNKYWFNGGSEGTQKNPFGL